MLADQPCFLTGEMLLAHVVDPLWWPIGGPHANGGKTCFQFALGPQPPTHIFPLGVSKHVFRRHRQQIRNMSLTGAPPTSYRKDQLHPRRIYFLTPQDTDCPNQPARRETLTEWRAETVSGIGQHTAEANQARDRAARCSTGTPARFIRAGSFVQLSGTKRRNAIITGTSRRASVSDTNVWQLAVLPSVEAYCGATPTERSPFFGIAVSSMTSTASLPPTSRSA